MAALFWYGVIAISALLLGLLLAMDQFAIAALVAGFGWLVLLPYHTRLSLYLATITFSSALILPYMPGRPYLWEFAAMLAWTGLPISISLRKYPLRFGETLRENRWLFVGIAIYCVVLGITMVMRGFGLRILGSGQMGGRFYIQQFLCAIFPLLFSACRVEEKTFVRLYALQWLMTVTYLVSDFVFSGAAGKLLVLLQFFELPNDALAFEIQSMRFGVRRFQSLGFVGQGLIFVLLISNSLRSFFSQRGFWLLPLTGAILVGSLLSGHRAILVGLAITLLIYSWTCRFLSARHVIVGCVAAALAIGAIYLTSERLPQAAQRAVSMLPGLKVDALVAVDASSTMWARKTLFNVGLTMIPEYFWLGRGFARYLDDYSNSWDNTTIMFHINQGKFYNGFIGLMINMGFFGTVGMLIFMFAGTRIAWRIIQHLRSHGCEDSFARAAGLVASLWMTNVFSFLFLHGDAEWAMKTFALQAGLLILCHNLLRERLQTQALAESEPAVAVPVRE